MVECPFCLGNGVIYKGILKGTDQVLYICDECDTVWRNSNIADISDENCDSFENVMTSLNRKALWSEFSEYERL